MVFTTLYVPAYASTVCEIGFEYPPPKPSDTGTPCDLHSPSTSLSRSIKPAGVSESLPSESEASGSTPAWYNITSGFHSKIAGKFFLSKDKYSSSPVPSASSTSIVEATFVNG